MNTDEYKKRKTVRLKWADYNRDGAVFLTVCTKNRQCLLSRIVGTGVPDGPQVVLSSYGEIAARYIEQLNLFYEDLSVESYVIMPNHIHILLLIKAKSDSPNSSLQNSIPSRFVSTLKRFCNKEYGENLWQSRSFDHIIRNRQDYEEHLRYIYENPLRWEKDILFEEV